MEGLVTRFDTFFTLICYLDTFFRYFDVKLEKKIIFSKGT